MLDIIGLVGLTTALGTPAATAVPNVADTPAPAAVEHAASAVQSVQAPSTVEGSFSFEQTGLSSLTEIREALGQAPKYLCGSQRQASADREATASTSSLEMTVKVDGDVSNPYEATISQLAEEVGTQRATMGCSCSGNTAGGKATVNADVAGIGIRALMEKAGVSSEANTVVFVSADGYEVALPLPYVEQRYSMIVFEVNGADIADSVGGSNQLWVGATSAAYFVRDVSEVRFETRDNPPATPGTEEAADEYANSPAIGFSGSKVAAA